MAAVRAAVQLASARRGMLNHDLADASLADRVAQCASAARSPDDAAWQRPRSSHRSLASRRVLANPVAIWLGGVLDGLGWTRAHWALVRDQHVQRGPHSHVRA